MRNSLTNRDTKSKEDDLANRKEGDSKDDVPNRPTVFQSPNDEDQLENDVNDDAGEVEDEFDDP